jgi:hypothetical protein
MLERLSSNFLESEQVKVICLQSRDTIASSKVVRKMRDVGSFLSEQAEGRGRVRMILPAEAGVLVFVASQ